MSETLWQFISLAASAGVLSAIVSGSASWWLSWRERQAGAAHLALELSVLLERYASGLIRALDAHHNHVISGGHVGDDFTYIPPMPPYPERHEVWPTLDIRLANRVLTLRLDVDQLNLDQRDTYTFLDEGGVDYALRDAARTAQVTAVLSRDLRHHYGIDQSSGSAHLLKRCVELKARHDFDAT